jgi:MFS family permease
MAYSYGGFGTALVLFALSRSFWLSAVVLVPVGFCMMLETASSNTLIQTMVPDRLRGRVMSVYSMMFMGMAPFGALMAGVLADRLGAPATVATGAVACMAGAAWFGLSWPKSRVDARRLVVAQAMAGGEPPVEQTGEVVAAAASGHSPRRR